MPPLLARLLAGITEHACFLPACAMPACHAPRLEARARRPCLARAAVLCEALAMGHGVRCGVVACVRCGVVAWACARAGAGAGGALGGWPRICMWVLRPSGCRVAQHGDGKLMDGGNVYDMTYLHGT
jgi:hypothetical protein